MIVLGSNWEGTNWCSRRHILWYCGVHYRHLAWCNFFCLLFYIFYAGVLFTWPKCDIVCFWNLFPGLHYVFEYSKLWITSFLDWFGLVQWTFLNPVSRYYSIHGVLRIHFRFLFVEVIFMKFMTSFYWFIKIHPI